MPRLPSVGTSTRTPTPRSSVLLAPRPLAWPALVLSGCGPLLDLPRLSSAGLALTWRKPSGYWLGQVEGKPGARLAAAPAALSRHRTPRIVVAPSSSGDGELET